jgi:hypothetical protein
MAIEQALHYAADFQHAEDRISIRSSVQCQMVISLHKYLDKSETQHSADHMNDTFAGRHIAVRILYKYLSNHVHICMHS